MSEYKEPEITLKEAEQYLGKDVKKTGNKILVEKPVHVSPHRKLIQDYQQMKEEMQVLKNDLNAMIPAAGRAIEYTGQLEGYCQAQKVLIEKQKKALEFLERQVRYNKYVCILIAGLAFTAGALLIIGVASVLHV